MTHPRMIAFFTPRMTIGGAETYIINKSNWLIDHGYNVLVISEGGEWVDRLSQNVRHFTINGIAVAPWRFSLKDLDSLIRKIIDVIDLYHVDIIEAHNTYPIIYALLLQKKRKVAILLNVLSELAYQRCPILCYITRRLDRHGQYFTLTDGMNEFIKRKTHHGLSNCTIIPIPVIFNESLEIKRDNYILSVCRMSSEKMYIKYLMDDFFELVDKGKINEYYKLLVVGDGPLFGAIQEKAQKLNDLLRDEKIILKGFCVGPELDRLYADCDIYVGMGTTLLTGAIYGKPSIIAGFTPETMPFAWGIWGVDDTAIGINIPNNNRMTYKYIIEHIISDNELYNYCSETAKIEAMKKYDIDAVMLQWNDGYNRIYKSLKFITLILLRPYIVILRLLYLFRVILRKYKIIR